MARNRRHKQHRHPAIIARLRRAGGHLKSATEMAVAERSCLGIGEQLQAFESGRRERSQDTDPGVSGPLP